jgi:hypothetical protein
MKTAWSEKRRFIFLPTFRFDESEYRMATKGLEKDPREEKFYDLEAEVYKGFLIPQGKKINIPDIFENIVWVQIFNLDNDEKRPHIKKIITKRGGVINLSTEGNAFVDQIFVCNMEILFPDYYEPDDEEDYEPDDEEDLD